MSDRLKNNKSSYSGKFNKQANKQNSLNRTSQRLFSRRGGVKL